MSPRFTNNALNTNMFMEFVENNVAWSLNSYISVRACTGLPRCVRADRGTENVTVCDIQRVFRADHGDEMAGEKSFLFGTSKSNQVVSIYKYAV